MPVPFDADKNDRLCRLIAKELRVDIDRVVPTARLDEDLLADHIDVVSLIVDVEEAFELDLTDDQFASVATVQDLLVLVGAVPAAEPAKAA